MSHPERISFFFLLTATLVMWL